MKLIAPHVPVLDMNWLGLMLAATAGGSKVCPGGKTPLEIVKMRESLETFMICLIGLEAIQECRHKIYAMSPAK